jgi:Cytochrome P460
MDAVLSPARQLIRASARGLNRLVAVKIVAHIAALVPLLAVVAVVQALWSLPADGQSGRGVSRGDGTPDAVVDAQGNLHVPSNYRAAYEFLGTWAIAADTGVGSRELHDVYATPGTIAAYRSSGHFPDGTVLIKEVYETSTAPMTTGTVSHARALKGWFVMLKDSKNSHPGNALWGDGWGWSWFDVGNPIKTTSTNYKKDCLSCHVPAQATDWVYTSGYPALK